MISSLVIVSRSLDLGEFSSSRMKASSVMVICVIVRVSNKVDIREEIDNVEEIREAETLFNKGRGICD